MVAEAKQSSLVLVMPNEPLDAVIKKVREAGTTSVQLLVPDGSAALRSQKDVEKLQRSVASRGIELLLITSDEDVLAAARSVAILAIGVQGSRVRLDAPGNGGRRSYETQVLPGRTQPVPAAPMRPVEEPPVVETDEDFLRALDDLSSAAPAVAAAGPLAPAPEDEDLFAALDDLSETMNSAPSRPAAPADYDDFAAELDALSDVAPGERDRDRAAAALGAGAAAAAAPRPRVRPEDIQLTDDEIRRARGTTPGSQTLQRSAPASERSRRGAAPAPAPHGEAAARRPRDDRAAGRPASSRPAWLIPALATVLVLLLLAIGAVLLLGGRATVVLNGPALPTEDIPFSAQTIPLIAVGDAPSSTAVQAEMLAAEAEFTATGTVAEETLAPATAAAGTVLLINLSGQQVTLPQGTDFIAVNQQGQEVRFASNGEVVVPGSSSARTGAQIITSFGQTQVGVIARSPGSASNVGANTITQVQAPGQQPINVRSGGILEVQHEPLGGGTEQPIRIVKDTDVQQVLGEALAGLDNRARQALEQAAQGQGLTIENTTISPRAEELSQGQGYELVVNPPTGQAVADPANPTFTVMVRGRFSALATPSGSPLQDQIQPALSEQLAISGKIKPGDGLAPFITNWHWDGARLTVDGLLHPTRTSDEIDGATRAAIESAIAGKSHEEATAALDELVQRNVISGYTLPEGDMPRWPFLIELQIVPARGE